MDNKSTSSSSTECSISDMLEAILAAGANPNAWSDEPKGKRRTLLQLAIEEANPMLDNSSSGLDDLKAGGRLHNVQLLLDAKADPNKASESSSLNHHLPLFTALEAGDEVLVRALLLSKADPNIKKEGEDEETPLHIAVRYGLVKSCEMLLRAGANVNVEDDYGRTPIHYGGPGPTTILNSLLKYGGDIMHVTPKTSETVLHTFAADEDTITDTIDWIIDRAPELLLSQPPPNNFTPLHVAAKKGNMSTCMHLFQYGGADHINKRGGPNFKHTAITLAHKYGHIHLAEALYYKKTMMGTATWSQWLHNPTIQITLIIGLLMLWINRVLLYEVYLDYMHM